MAPETVDAVKIGLGGAIGIALMVGLAQLASIPLAAVPFATSIVLVVSAPGSPQARPRNILGGHVICTLSGFMVLWLFGSVPMLAALAVGLGMGLMAVTGTLHPPAGINGLLVVSLAPPWTYIFVPVLTGCLVLIGYAAVFHGFAHPGRWPANDA
jgi:CBS-domain-containing membrane protein